MSFDLTAAIAAELDRGTTADPGVVWANVVAKVPARDLRATLTQVGHGFAVQIVNSRTRAVTDAVPRPISTRWADAGTVYTNLLAERLFTPDGWKFLGDCTATDLAAAADSRMKQAAELADRAGFYTELAAMLTLHGAATVSDLPTPILNEVAA